jgi:hypothetical protein
MTRLYDRMIHAVRQSPAARLSDDLAEILTGPTSGGNAERLAGLACTDPDELACRMLEACERYFSGKMGGGGK